MIELAMVILVIGIIAAIMLPRFGGLLDRQQLRHTINVVRGMVRYTQARAALTKRVYRLRFDIEKQTLSACYLQSDNTCQEEVTGALRTYTFPDVVRILDVVSPQGEKTVEGEAVTHFHPTGLAEPSIIHLGTLTDQKVTLIIEPLAGNVKVIDDYVEPDAG
jgi:Tfp pilus assembly protein FimT